MSIIKVLDNIAKEELISFHVPGHKNGRLLNKMSINEKLGYYDTTEIDGTDNLHAPQGAIKEAQDTASSFYGALESFYLVNGTTAGNIVMMYSAFEPGDKVLICRDAHKSVFTGAILSQINPIYITPQIDKKLGVSLGLTANQVKEAFDKEPDIKGIVMTYPSYHGICSQIEKIEEIVHGREALLLVDAAHGAHLNLSESLPICAVTAKVDIVVHSTHKSLPSFTQSSILHYCSKRVSLERLKMALSMFQSSSPSYLLMASLENAVSVAKENGRQYMDALLLTIDLFSQKIEEKTVFKVLKSHMLADGYVLDPTKITLLTNESGMTGRALEDCLRKDFAIQCEYGTDSAVLFITSIATAKDDLECLFDALVDISQEIQDISDKKHKNHLSYDFEAFDLEVLLQPYQATYTNKEIINLKASIGHVAGDFIVPYPPGIPIVVPGEVISEQVVNFIEEGIRKGYNINGVYGKNELQVNIIKKVTK